jgi:phenylacetate-CoA ligase
MRTIANNFSQAFTVAHSGTAGDKTSLRSGPSAGELAAWKLFRAMARRVPAYGAFLRQHGVDPKRIRVPSELLQVPPADKTNYIDAFPLNELCWDGRLDRHYMLSSSSGSTGRPYLWPRSTKQTSDGARLLKPLYREYFGMHRQPTLLIIGFAMGTWIAGTYMMMATQELARRGWPITVATPGMNQAEILKLFQEAGRFFPRIVLSGYPPFIKDVIEAGADAGIRWPDIDLKFLFSAEAFTEGWRENLQRLTGIKDVCRDAINLYGSADVGLMAHETAASIRIRRLVSSEESLAVRLFGQTRVPSLNQFNPVLRHFECLQGELHITADSGLPLCRYNTKDLGGVLSAEEIGSRLRKAVGNLPLEMSKERAPLSLWQWPFVYLYGRGQFTATVYGVNIYPEHVKTVLDHPELTSCLTGRFRLASKDNARHDQVFHVELELRDRLAPSDELAARVRRIFVERLPSLNGEYRQLLEFIGSRAHPEIQLRLFADRDRFPHAVIRKAS